MDGELDTVLAGEGAWRAVYDGHGLVQLESSAVEHCAEVCGVAVCLGEALAAPEGVGDGDGLRTAEAQHGQGCLPWRGGGGDDGVGARGRYFFHWRGVRLSIWFSIWLGSWWKKSSPVMLSTSSMVMA